MTTKTIMAVSAMAMVLAASVSAQAQTAGLNPNGIDPEHYKCYAVLEPLPPFQPLTVLLEDQFGKKAVRLQKIIYLCTPVSKNNEVLADRLSHLACYSFSQAAAVPPPKVIVKNQFGSTQLTVGRSGLLCVPSFKQVLPQ